MNLILCIALLGLNAAAAGQLLPYETRYPGYFINSNGDSIRGYIKYVNRTENQLYAEYSNDARGEKLKFQLYPHQVRGYYFAGNVYESLRYGEADPGTDHFVLREEEGKLDLFRYFVIPTDVFISDGQGSRRVNGFDESYLESEFLVRMEGGKLIPVLNNGDLLKKFLPLIDSDVRLAELIREKEKGFRLADLPQIVRSYNGHY
jgi:hypothetical protein